MDVQFNGDEGYPTVPTTAYKYFFNWKLIKLGCETERMKKDIKVIPSPKFQLKDTARVCSQPVYQVCGPNPPTGRTYRYLWSPSSNDTNQCKGAIASGWYNLTVTNEFGCVEKDSTEITVDPSPVFNLGPDTSFCRLRLHTINTGLDSTKNIVTWNNSMAGVRIAVQSPGVYIATAYNTANFCMSKDTMNLSLKDTTSSILTITACDSFYWAAKNKTYTSNNTDTANLINAVGCDSIVRLNLTIKNSTSSTFTTSACDSYYWPAKNKTYTTSNNTDTVKLINAAGCDSIVTLNLTIKNSTSSTFTTSACDSYYWPAKNKTYTTSNNTDTVKLINAAGCDSIVTLNLTIKNSNSSTFTTSACDSYYWTTKNKTYTTSNNTDTVKLINAAGCDSIVTLNLTIKNATSSTFTISACDSYYWTTKNKTYTTSNNTDTVKLINAAGCDSIVTLNLTIKNATSSTFTTSACDSYYWPAKNKTYTISNNTDTVKLINAAGCDSIVTLNLTIKNSNSSTFTTSACDSFYWAAKNKTYTTSNNTDTVKLINAAGCDSIVTLNLTIKNSTSSTFTTSACDSYYWTTKNKTYTTNNNTDTVKLINAAGCDSIVTLNLTIKNATSSTFTTSACDSYYWPAKNKTYTISNNTDTVKLINVAGCDSIVTLNLTIKNATSSTFTTSACDSYYWPAKNKTYTISNNTDTVKLINTAGCDSIVTLNLTIKNSNSSTFTISACGSYYWPAKNKSYTTSNNTDTVKLINAAGCDSIVTLNLTIKNALSSSSTFTISACGSYYWAIKNKTYTISNNSDTVKLINAAGCDSIVTLSLTIYPNPIPTIIKTGNVLSTQYYNSYQWLLNGVNIIGATTQSYTVVVSGNYQVVVTDTNNCSGASSIGAVILSSLNEAGKDYFKIYPNPSEKMLHIETNASGNWQAIITDVKGSQINQIHFNKSTQLDISNYSPGVYYIQLTGKENVLNYKFMKK
jgi:hypothetical protein